ncbi:MAG: hypothetical protein AAFX99_31510, partial [Myxococcota bacterium]
FQLDIVGQPRDGGGFILDCRCACGESCNDVPFPAEGTCNPGSTPTPINDAQGCVLAWTCSPSDCPQIDVDINCGERDQAVDIIDENGCPGIVCRAIDFECGSPELICAAPEQYCEELIPGVPSPSDFSCMPIPNDCLVDIPEIPDCECIQEVLGPLFGCEVSANGEVNVSAALP